jgi:hypothetical protein
MYLHPASVITVGSTGGGKVMVPEACQQALARKRWKHVNFFLVWQRKYDLSIVLNHACALKNN